MNDSDHNSLEVEIDAFMSNYDRMLQEHHGQWTVFKNSECLGFWNIFENAYNAGLKEYGIVPMLIRQITIEYSIYGRYGKPAEFRAIKSPTKIKLENIV